MKKLLLTTFLFTLCWAGFSQSNWTLSNNGIPSNFVTQDLLAVSSTEIIAVGAINNSGWTPRIYKSTDGGENWANITISGIDASQVMYNSLCYTGSTMLMSTHNGSVDNTGIYASTDGVSWTLSDNGIPDNFVTQDLLAVSSTEIIAVGAINNSGWTPEIYKSIDGGINWNNISISGIDGSQVMYNSLFNTGSTMLMSTHNGSVDNTGIYASTDLISGVDTYNENKLDLSISNPVSDKLTIRSVKGIKSITITNMQGRIVYSQENFLESDKEISLDVSSYANGLYLMTVHWENAFKSVKVLKQ